MAAEPWMHGSRYSPHAKLMHNRLAYEVLEAVYHLIPADTRGGPIHDNPLDVGPALHDYQNWLHQRLRDSGLAKALAAGPDFLPDIAAELPPFWRYFARLTAPRNYRRLAEQVTRNLAWYAGEGTPPITLAHTLYRSLAPALILTALTFLAMLPTTVLGGQPWPVLLLAAFILLAVNYGAVSLFGQDSSGRFKANCAELYAYLLESYAEPGPETENLVRSLLEEFDRDTDTSVAAQVRRAQRHGRL